MNYDVILITNNIVFKCVFTSILRRSKEKDNYDDGDGDEDDDAPWNCSWDAKLYIDSNVDNFCN